MALDAKKELVYNGLINQSLIKQVSHHNKKKSYLIFIPINYEICLLLSQSPINHNVVYHRKIHIHDYVKPSIFCVDIKRCY